MYCTVLVYLDPDGGKRNQLYVTGENEVYTFRVRIEV